jgi:hypothetical protein
MRAEDDQIHVVAAGKLNDRTCRVPLQNDGFRAKNPIEEHAGE